MGFTALAYSQEVVSETTEYVAHEDSLFILKQTTVTNQGIEGVNDTLVEYLPPAIDSAGLIDLLFVESVNATNTTNALFRRALGYRKVFNTSNTYAGLLSELGADRDSMMVKLYASKFKGTYRLITDLETRTFVLEDHPNRNDVLRMNEFDGVLDENLNVTITSSWSLKVRIGAETIPFVWSGTDRDKPVFYKENFILPKSNLPVDNTRWKKIK